MSDALKQVVCNAQVAETGKTKRYAQNQIPDPRGQPEGVRMWRGQQEDRPFALRHDHVTRDLPSYTEDSGHRMQKWPCRLTPRSTRWHAGSLGCLLFASVPSSQRPPVQVAFVYLGN